MIWNSERHPKIFPGWPKTKCDKKKREVKISAAYLSPEGAQIRDVLSGFTILATIILGLMYQKRFGLGWPHTIGAGVILTLNYYFILPFFLSARVWMVFADDHFRIKTLFTWWRRYDLFGVSYGFQHGPHIKGQEGPMGCSKESYPYYLKSFQIMVSHCQGLVILPGIYGWGKSLALYNRILGVEGWVHNTMPRVWPQEAPYDVDVTPKKRGWFMKGIRVLAYLFHFILWFIVIYFALCVFFGGIGKLIGWVFGPEAGTALHQFMNNLHPLIGAAIVLIILFFCGHQAKTMTDEWDAKTFSPKGGN